jgi:hypothetical protein
MAQVRENLTELEGAIARREPDPLRPGYERVTLEVSRTAPVEDKPDLVHAAPGDTVPVSIRSDLLADVDVGSQVRLRAARTSSGDIMGQPHPPDPR